MATRSNPYGNTVAYTAALRRAIEHIEGQIEATEKHLGWGARVRTISDYAKLLGYACALVAIAEEHRQWDDAKRWQALQGKYAMLVSNTIHPGAHHG